MKTALSRVNTYAWMYATRSSSAYMKMLKRTEMKVIELPRAAPALNPMKIKMVRTSIAICPPSIFAKSLIIKAIGFVKIPISSIRGMSGTGALSQVGTSGQRISFQYSLDPNTFTAMKVQRARNMVMDIFAVTPTPPGNIGRRLIRLQVKIKKKAVRRYGENFL